MRYPRRLYTTSPTGDMLEPSRNVQQLWLWVERFQNEYARQNRSAQTIIEYGYDLASLVCYMDEMKVQSFNNVDSRFLRDFLDWLRLKEEISPVTLNRRLACLRSFFRYLLEEGIIDENPAAAIRKAKQQKTASHTYLIADEAAQLLDQVDGNQRFAKRDLAMIALMLFCGLRISEVASLDIEDIRFREQVLVVHGKGNKIRELPLDPHISQILQDHLAERGKVHSSSKSPDADNRSPMELAKRQLNNQREAGSPLFLSSRHTRITTRAIHMVVQQHVSHIDVENGKHISPHKLRHTFATLLYLNGADINVLRELLGHVDLSTTQIYAAVDQDRKKQAMASHPLLPPDAEPRA